MKYLYKGQIVTANSKEEAIKAAALSSSTKKHINFIKDMLKSIIGNKNLKYLTIKADENYRTLQVKVLISSKKLNLSNFDVKLLNIELCPRRSSRPTTNNIFEIVNLVEGTRITKKFKTKNWSAEIKKVPAITNFIKKFVSSIANVDFTNDEQLLNLLNSVKKHSGYVAEMLNALKKKMESDSINNNPIVKELEKELSTLGFKRNGKFFKGNKIDLDFEVSTSGIDIGGYFDDEEDWDYYTIEKVEEVKDFLKWLKNKLDTYGYSEDYSKDREYQYKAIDSLKSKLKKLGLKETKRDFLELNKGKVRAVVTIKDTLVTIKVGLYVVDTYKTNFASIPKNNLNKTVNDLEGIVKTEVNKK